MMPAIKPHNIFIFLSPAQKAQRHKHDFFELVYVLSGKCEHTINDHTYVMSKGDFVLLDDKFYHSYKVIGNEELAIVNCLFYPSFIDYSIPDEAELYTVLENYHFKFKKELFTQHPVGTVFSDKTGDVEKLLTVMNNEFLNKKAGYLELIRGNLIQLLVILMRNVYVDINVSNKDETIQNILEYMNINYMNNITLKDICARFNYSLPYMSSKFKKYAGISFMEYLQKIRVENSMKLLSDSGLAVSDIARNVGYSDIKFYYRIFKKHTGTTPAEFRKNNNNFDPSVHRFARRKYKKI